MSIAIGSPVRLDWSGRRAETWSWLPLEEIEPETPSKCTTSARSMLPCAWP